MRRDWAGGLFGIGLNAQPSEFRHADVTGRPVDAAAETPTQRDERIRMLQDRRGADGPREAPPASPAGILAELITRDPGTRMSGFARHLAEFPELMPRADVILPGRPLAPGGLAEEMAGMSAARASQGWTG
jgi:hypothetical protein